MPVLHPSNFSATSAPVHSVTQGPSYVVPSLPGILTNAAMFTASPRAMGYETMFYDSVVSLT